MRVLSYREGDVLPSDVHVGIPRSCPCPPAARDHDPSAVRVRHATPTPTSPHAPQRRRYDDRRRGLSSCTGTHSTVTAPGSLEPGYRVSVGDDTFLIAPPIFDIAGVTGRGTRAYIAWHEQSRSFVFFKDVWRQLYPESSRRRATS